MGRFKRVLAALIMAATATLGVVAVTAAPAQADMCRQWDGTYIDC